MVAQAREIPRALRGAREPWLQEGPISRQRDSTRTEKDPREPNSTSPTPGGPCAGRFSPARLARSAAETAVADIVLAVDEPIRATRCAGQGTPRGCMAGGERCITHHLWEDLGAEIHAYLAAVSLEDVVMKRTGARRRAAPMLAEGAAA